MKDSPKTIPKGSKHYVTLQDQCQSHSNSLGCVEDQFVFDQACESSLVPTKQKHLEKNPALNTSRLFLGEIPLQHL